MRNSWIIGLLLLLCYYLSCPKPAARPGKVICILFDLSQSTKRLEIRKMYLNNLQLILSKINHGDVLTACPITERSIAEPEFIFKHEVARFMAITNNPLYKSAEQSQADRKLQVARDSLYSIADSVLLCSPRVIMRTDIMSSLQVAERIFKSFSQPRKILVIMSDMIEDSESYNFETENLTTQRINQIIANEKGRIPDLKDVRVYAAGATAKDKDRFYRICDFWLSYFQTCGANLLKQNYGATLINFDE